MAESLRTEWRKDHVPQELIELRNHMDKLPAHLRDRLLPLCERVGHYTRLQGRLVKIAQDAVDQLQLDVKYLMFDLEATRRERDEFRNQLEELLEE
jgi:hypothetical protein